MDPSQLQTDKENDAGSLGVVETIVEGDGAKPAARTEVIDAAGSKGDTPSPVTPKKVPLFKRLWQRFNIYLLLFVLLTLVAVGVLIVLIVKDSRSNAKVNTIDSQNLSEVALDQLANATVNVGSSKQILSVESSAVFSSSVLVRGDLEVAGSIKVGKDIELPNVSVLGSGTFNQLQATDLAIAGNASVQGTFTAKKGVSVSGNSTFDGRISATQITTGSLQLDGVLTLTHHIATGGPVPGLTKGTALGSGGTASISGSDTSGAITINTGGSPPAGCFATVSFARPYQSTPNVIATPIGSAAAGLDFYVNRSTGSFSVCAGNPAPAGQTFGFDYMVME